MDTSARSRAPPNQGGQPRRYNQRAWGNAAQADYGRQEDPPQNQYAPPRKKGPCFKCRKEGHFAQDCQSTRACYINYMDQNDDMSQLQDAITPENILDNAIKMFDTLPRDQKDAFIQKYEGSQEDFAEV